ncbi:MAG: sulfurtransferase [Chloroflexaceae bacterium]|nr:sulfurtransferase [Chloroflexaceae bacterium]
MINVQRDQPIVVTTSWIADHLDDPDVRLVESNQDSLLYATGHIPGAVSIDWLTDVHHPIRRDYIDRETFAKLLSTRGIQSDTTIVLYGDQYNWWAVYTFWVLHWFGHRRVCIMDGGRMAWQAEARPLTRSIPDYAATTYPVPAATNQTVRALRHDVLQQVMQPSNVLVDVRSEAEYRGEQAASSFGVTTQRQGHIPGAIHVPWSLLVQENHTFKPAHELAAVFASQGLTDKQPIITYCLVGVLSSYAWFLLTYRLNLPNVRCYDGGWAEWGNLVGVPIATGSVEKTR